MNIFRNRRLAAAIASVCILPALSAQTVVETVEVIATEHDSTFNALDYVLQRPAPARKFSEKKFGDRWFFAVEAGPTFMRSTDGPNTYHNLEHGLRGGLTFGDWCTPAHGWRVGINAGYNKGVADKNIYFGGVSVDYLINLTGLQRGDRFSRFEFIGAVGLEGEMLHRTNRHWYGYGLRLGFQARLNVTKTTFIFAEPRIGVYSDKLDDVRSWHHYDWQAAVMFGLGYRMYREGRWTRSVDNSAFVNNRFRDNMFVSLGGGIATATTDPHKFTDNLSGMYSLSVGKWFTAVSGLRLKASAGDIKQPRTRYVIGILDLDYMFNVNSFLNGYDPDRKIETNVMVGISGAYGDTGNRHFFAGMHAGMQWQWNVSHRVGLYLEPQVHVLQGTILREQINNRMAVMPGVAMGITYRLK